MLPLYDEVDWMNDNDTLNITMFHNEEDNIDSDLNDGRNLEDNEPSSLIN